MNFESFGHIKIVRPSIESELFFRQKLEAFVRGNFETKKYVTKNEISSILNKIVSYLDTELRENIKQITSRDFIEFILYQYDLSYEINQNLDTLGLEQKERWRQLGPIFRRAVKYIAELSVLYQHDDIRVLDNGSLEKKLDICFICAEQIYIFSAESDTSFHIFPDDTFLEILPASSKNYIRFSLSKKYEDFSKTMLERISYDTKHKASCFDLNDIPMYNASICENFLNSVFQSDLGISYSECIGCINTVIDCSIPAQNSFVPFCEKKMIIKKLNASYNIAFEKIKLALSAFTISKEKMLEENRVCYKPKQKYRASARAFFELNWKTGMHYVWSPKMAVESYVTLCRNIVFGNVPPEWYTDAIKTAIGSLNLFLGKWFEKKVGEKLSELGYRGKLNVKNIGNGCHEIIVPQEGVGEIDFLGYSCREKILLIVECKLVKEGFDPVYFRDSIKEFTVGEKSYAHKFRNKIDWVISNIEQIRDAIEFDDSFDNGIDIQNIRKVMITFAPLFASIFIDDFPCVSLVEFVHDYQENKVYPYD